MVAQPAAVRGTQFALGGRVSMPMRRATTLGERRSSPPPHRGQRRRQDGGVPGSNLVRPELAPGVHDGTTVEPECVFVGEN